MESKLSYNSLVPHLLNLRIAGCYYLDRKSPKLYRHLHVCFMRISFIWVLMYTTQQALKVYEVRNDMDRVTGTLFLFLTHTDLIYKQITMWIKAAEIQELFDIMKGPLYNQGEPDHEKYLLKTTRHGKLFLQVDTYSALFTCFLWIVYPCILHIQGEPVEFAIWLPYNTQANYTFYLTALYVWVTTSWLAFCNTTIDVTVAFLLAQYKTQLAILRNNLINLVQRSTDESILTEEPFGDVINKRFDLMIRHHVQILYFAKKVQDIFGGVVAYQFLVSGWIICTSVYRMVDADPGSVEYLSMVMYIFCIFIQVFMYCYYGNEATYQSDKLMESAYYMDWLDTPLSHRRHLIFFMERIKKPIVPLAGSIIPLSNNTLVSIIKSSYSLYALLRNTGENK